MTVDEKLNLILDDFSIFKDSQQFIIQTLQQLTQGQQGLTQGYQELRQEIQGLKQEVEGLKQEVEGLKQEVEGLKREIEELKQGQKEIWLHLENKTDKNIQLLAENYLTLVDKLNSSINVQNRGVLFELKTTYLEDRISKIEKDVAELKKK